MTKQHVNPGSWRTGQPSPPQIHWYGRIRADCILFPTTWPPSQPLPLPYDLVVFPLGKAFFLACLSGLHWCFLCSLLQLMECDEHNACHMPPMSRHSEDRLSSLAWPISALRRKKRTSQVRCYSFNHGPKMKSHVVESHSCPTAHLWHDPAGDLSCCRPLGFWSCYGSQANAGYILRTLWSDTADAELGSTASVLVFTNTRSTRKDYRVRNLGTSHTQITGAPELREETRGEHTSWTSFKNVWASESGGVDNRCQGLSTCRFPAHLISRPQWEEGCCKSRGEPHATPLFLLPAGGEDAETFTFVFEWKYLSVQIITLQLIMQSKQYTWDLNIMTAWKFTVFQLNMQQVLPNVCWKVAQD